MTDWKIYPCIYCGGDAILKFDYTEERYYYLCTKCYKTWDAERR
jgi:hypothetical protein